MPNSSVDFTIRTTAFYAAEGFVGLILSVIFFYFSKVYDRHFVKVWGLSWMAFCLAMISLIAITINDVSSTGIMRHVFSFLSIVMLLYQVFFLLIGSRELVRYKRVSRRAFLFWSFLIVIVGLCVVLPYASDPQGGQARYLIRLGFRYFVTSAGFITAAYITARSLRLSKGIGKTLVAVSFFAYGFYHFYYIFIVISNATSHLNQFPFLFGIVELIIVSLTGLSMAIWLLEDERDSLLKTNRDLDDFFYRVSHDLRSPITSMQGVSNLAKLRLNEPEALSYLDMIDRSIVKLDRVILDLTSISKKRLIKLKLESINFNLLIADIRSQINDHGKKSAVDLRYEERKENVLVCDRNLLKMILVHLIDNAMAFTRNNQPQPFVRVSFARASGKVLITVEDNGLGMHKESLPKIFNLFYKENAQTQGSGLGLYSVKDMLDKLNGTISVQSDLGDGSVFVITLPAL